MEKISNQIREYTKNQILSTTKIINKSDDEISHSSKI